MNNDCRTCKHNYYLPDTSTDWVACNHPITLERGPRWQKGDPAMVNFRTSDVPIKDIHYFADCPTWESRQKSEPAEAGASTGSSSENAIQRQRQ